MANRDVRDELLALQQTDPQLQAEYDRRIREMMERELKPWQKVFAVVVGLGGIAMFLGLGYLNLMNLITDYYSGAHKPWQAYAGLTVTMLFTLGAVLLVVSTLRRGRMTRMHGNVQAGLVWAFVLFLFIGTFIQAGRAGDKDFTTWAMLHTLGWLVIGAVFVIVNQIRQSALSTQEEILRLQLRVEQLASGKAQEQT